MQPHTAVSVITKTCECKGGVRHVRRVGGTENSKSRLVGNHMHARSLQCEGQYDMAKSGIGRMHTPASLAERL